MPFEKDPLYFSQSHVNINYLTPWNRVLLEKLIVMFTVENTDTSNFKISHLFWVIQ